MNLEKFTIKSQEAIQMAQQIALGNQNQSIEAVHLLKAIAQVDQVFIMHLMFLPLY